MNGPQTIGLDELVDGHLASRDTGGDDHDSPTARPRGPDSPRRPSG